MEISEEKAKEALWLVAQAVEDGLMLVADIEACREEPWRFSYPRYVPDHRIAVAAANQARRAMRLLGIPVE